MKDFKYIWAVGLVVTALIVITPIVLFVTPDRAAEQDPWQHVPSRVPDTGHQPLIEGPFDSPQEVTATCLACHEDSAYEVMGTTHWTWESEPVEVAGRAEPVTTGKKNVINNYCIGIQGNWASCTACHAGYGWDDAAFEFEEPLNVDCLVCHDQSGTYVKGTAGAPVEGVDLVMVAQSVGTPTRENCGSCHFYGGGGDAVKHGDMDSSLTNPGDDIDVHMGRHDFVCIDCHQTEEHRIGGRSITVSMTNENQIACTDCHVPNLHADERINDHTDTVACQTCHIPQGATRQATKTHWDWSTAGSDDFEESHDYLKIKGSFIYETNITPEYYWYNGTADRYLLGDGITPATITPLNQPHGSIDDSTAMIWPFKVHRALQPYDAVHNILLQPHTAGEGGFWDTFDWDSALANGAEYTGLPYSGEYGFTETAMWWPLTHMVQPAEFALGCVDCHGDDGRFDWVALGYPGDPLEWGGRTTTVGTLPGDE